MNKKLIACVASALLVTSLAVPVAASSGWIGLTAFVGKSGNIDLAHASHQLESSGSGVLDAYNVRAWAPDVLLVSAGSSGGGSTSRSFSVSQSNPNVYMRNTWYNYLQGRFI